MRVLGVLLILLVGLGLGVVPEPASAEPCPHPTHGVPEVPQETGGKAAEVAPGIETVMVAALESAAAVDPDPDSDHAVPEGQSCCHAAPTAAQAFGATVMPPYRPAGGLRVRGSLPPPAAPTTDIYRPPAFA